MIFKILKYKAVSPLIATILLVVVAVILVSIILSFGKDFTTKSLDKTNSIQELTVSDAGSFIYPKGIDDGVLQITYQPPATIQGPVVVTSYNVLEIPEMETKTLTTPITLTNNTVNILDLECLYEYSLENPDMTVQLITEDNTYINIKTKDSGMVCSSGGTGTEADPIIICNAEDLNNMRNDLDANYSLGKDIDLQCFLNSDINGWVPIGNSTNKFKGIFDGRNRTIKNLYINRPTTEGVGFFGVVDTNSTIKYIGLKDTNIYGRNLVGSLTGVNYGAILNSYANGHVKSTGLGGGHANTGGLVGVNSGINSGGTMRYSYFEGNVEGYGAGSMVGGLVGQNIIKGYISNCFAKGAVYGVGNYVGGLSGANDGARGIDNSYADCSVVGLSSAVGGFVGAVTLSTESGILNSYSKGSVTGITSVGGFVGLDYGETFTNIYWDINTSGQETSDGGEGKTTTEMKTQSTFTDWDFSTVWAIDSTRNDGYPSLRNNLPR